ncbi:MAG TPA: hypothetical protein PLS55_10820 [Thermogutta sp.]|nr:hypothetical protein [Thermogutta sp.]
MPRRRVNIPLILVTTVWYALTAVMGTSLHHHLGWHPVVGTSIRCGGCYGSCGFKDSEGSYLLYSTAFAKDCNTANIGRHLRMVATFRTTVGAHQWSQCPICQFQVQPRTIQNIFQYVAGTYSHWAPQPSGVALVVFTPDFSWHSRAPPTV